MQIAARVPGIVATDRVRARRVGNKLFVEITVAVSRTLPIDRVAAIKDALTRAITAEIPEAETSVTTDPRALNDETVLDRVMVIARNRALAVHHVTTVHTADGRLLISLDLEVDGTLALGVAHDIASGLEAAVIGELGSDVEVETHIEPLQPSGREGRDAPQSRVAEVEHALAEYAARMGLIGEIHDVRVRETGDGEIVNFHCRVAPEKSVHDVHEKVDELERALRRHWPSIMRVIGHAEPRRP
jgi:divalent metal cation (Fe/Co/Zn/Cd) transporter